jgi:serine/threonine protein kinase
MFENMANFIQKIQTSFDNFNPFALTTGTNTPTEPPRDISHDATVVTTEQNMTLVRIDGKLYTFSPEDTTTSPETRSTSGTSIGSERVLFNGQVGTLELVPEEGVSTRSLGTVASDTDTTVQTTVMVNINGVDVPYQFSEANIIGQGADGYVYRATIDPNFNNTQNLPTEIIVKEAKPVGLEALQQEITLFERLKSHPNLIGYYGSTVQDGRTFVFLESGQTAFNKQPFLSNLSTEERLNAVDGLISSINYLHKNNISHGDVSLKNMVIGADGTFKLIDLGGAKDFSGGDTITLPIDPETAAFLESIGEPVPTLTKANAFKTDGKETLKSAFNILTGREGDTIIPTDKATVTALINEIPDLTTAQKNQLIEVFTNPNASIESLTAVINDIKSSNGLGIGNPETVSPNINGGISGGGRPEVAPPNINGGLLGGSRITETETFHANGAVATRTSTQNGAEIKYEEFDENGNQTLLRETTHQPELVDGKAVPLESSTYDFPNGTERLVSKTVFSKGVPSTQTNYTYGTESSFGDDLKLEIGNYTEETSSTFINGQPVKTGSKLYNSENNLVAEKTYSTDGKLTSEKLYDNTGKLTSEKRYNANGVLTYENRSFIYGGPLTEESVYNEQGILQSQKLTSYDDAGNPLESKLGVYDEEGNTIQVESVKYDTAGKIISKSINEFAPTGGLLKSTTYDTNNNPLSEKTYNSDGIETLTVEHSYQYDDTGKITNQRTTSHDHTTGQSSEKTTIHAYDNTGKLTSTFTLLAESYTDASGNTRSTQTNFTTKYNYAPEGHIASETNIYHTDNDRAETTVFDANGARTATGASDANGQWQGAVRFFDANGTISRVGVYSNGVETASYDPATNTFSGINFDGVMSTQDLTNFDGVVNALREEGDIRFSENPDNAKYGRLIETLDFVQAAGLPISAIENFDLTKPDEFTLNADAVKTWVDQLQTTDTSALNPNAATAIRDFGKFIDSSQARGIPISGLRTIGWLFTNVLAGDTGDTISFGQGLYKFAQNFSNSKIFGKSASQFTPDDFHTSAAKAPGVGAAKAASIAKFLGPVATVISVGLNLYSGITGFKEAQENGASNAELAYWVFSALGGGPGGGITAAIDAKQKGYDAGVATKAFFAGLFGLYDPNNPDASFKETVSANREEYQTRVSSREALANLYIPSNPATGDPGFDGRAILNANADGDDNYDNAYNWKLENAFYNYMATYHSDSPNYVPRIEGVNGEYIGLEWRWAPGQMPIWGIKEGVSTPVTNVDDLVILKFTDQPVWSRPPVSQTGGSGPGPGGFGCWVARAVYGENNPRWLAFREWLVNKAPAWFRNLYFSYGPQFADFIKDKPWLKTQIRAWMDTKIDPHTDFGTYKYVHLMELYQKEKNGAVTSTEVPTPITKSQLFGRV